MLPLTKGGSGGINKYKEIINYHITHVPYSSKYRKVITYHFYCITFLWITVVPRYRKVIMHYIPHPSYYPCITASHFTLSNTPHAPHITYPIYQMPHTSHSPMNHIPPSHHIQLASHSAHIIISAPIYHISQARVMCM